MNIGVKLLNPVSNCTRIRNCIEDYVASIFPFDLQIGWFMGSINYQYPDKPEDGSIGYIAFEVSGKDRMKLKTARYLTRKCKLTNVPLNDEQIRILAEKLNSLLWTDDELNNVELIRGNAITEAYENEIGGSSCMTGCNSSYTKLYASNPTRFEMLIIRNNNDSARAIIHKLDNGRKLLGTIYTTTEHLCDKMQDYAIQQDWIIKTHKIADKSILIMSSLSYREDEIPYMDTLTQGEIVNNLLTASYNGGSFNLQDQDGGLGGYQCENCGNRVNEDDIYDDGEGNSYCEYCFNENFTYCPDCDDTIHITDTIFIQDKEIYVCQYCADKHYYRCYDCGDYHTLDDMQIFNDESYCESCFGEVADYCENCNETFCIEDLTFIDDSGPLCADCVTEIQEAEGIIL